ncbi:SDR family NAD(P)-dependent oxidoreductase [Microbacterium sp. NIBRBAC000506063]|uniref:SDR family NAD(P)-dependent oxidoreductase n=1 Tax=Microbacterium sp. NIBRBAC000506063 TaxID=2734618 RepID=UPI001BB7E580|nr:SDR family oxidoreductase [Microbacterium sp. NIBRBAC000506063]QTV79061.1 SDR family oxidoreductase [Microbacterium sp. NIBRBAC000506063]
MLDSGHGPARILPAATLSDVDGVAVVTGGSGGIGSAIVRRLAGDGVRTILTYRSAAPSALLDELGDRVVAFPLDVRDAAGARSLAEAILERHGAVHTVVHAAGPHVPMVHLSKVSVEQFAQQLDDDLVGFFAIAQAFLPALRASSGSLTAVTSAATRRYPVRDGLSAAPKGGVEALARGLAAEEGRFGIRVNCVGPGMLWDGMSARLMASGDLDERALEVARTNIPLRRFGTAEDIAAAVAFLASPRPASSAGRNSTSTGASASDPSTRRRFSARPRGDR